jgi:hypothetical protein
VFLGIEYRTPTDVTTYGYGWGAAAIRKSDMNVTALPKLHKTDDIYTNSYASLIFGNYLVDSKTNYYVYVIDISDVDNWNINENIGARTLKAYKIFKTDGVTQNNYSINEIVLDNGIFSGFLWSTMSRAIKFSLTGLDFTATPKITSINATIRDLVFVDFEGYILDNGGYDVTECGFKVGQQSDLSDGVSYACDNIETNFHRMVEIVGYGTFYWQAYAVNEAGTGYGTIGNFYIEPQIAPTVETTSVSNLEPTGAKVNCNLTNLGSFNPTAHGVCYNLTGSPTVSDSLFDLGSVSGICEYYCDLTNLISGQKYYVTAFATNSIGTSYGDVIDFTTISSPGFPTSPSAVTYTEVTLTWIEPEDLGGGTLSGYKIERKEDGGSWSTVEETYESTTYYDIITKKTYYRVSTITVEYGAGETCAEVYAIAATGSYKIYLGEIEIVVL